MDNVYATLEHLKALWLKLGRTKRNTLEYDALVKEIRIESDAYQVLVQAETSPHRTGEDST